MVSDTINMTPDNLKELRRLYNEAQPGEVFKFQGKDVLREYAKYLIEYSEMRLRESS